MSVLSASSEQQQDVFTMIFLDFDDTLIPSRIYRLFAHNLSIDIFELFSSSKMLKLQNTIIKTIQYITKQYKKNNECVEFCIVSNASQRWLDYMFKGNVSLHITSRIPILNEYCIQNNIPVISASIKSYEFLQSQFGNKANEIFTHSENKQNRWMWKYTAFGCVISELQRKTNKKCKQIISIGDGNDEEKALNHYSKMHKMKSLHIKCIKSPTIDQLQNQWIYLMNNLQSYLESQPESQLFCVCDLRTIIELKSDNNNSLIGITNQLPAIRNYFQLWMDQLLAVTTLDQQQIAIQEVCSSIHKKMYSIKSQSESRTFKLILIKAICKHKQFNTDFNAYYRKVEQHNKRLSIKCSS